MLVVDSNGLTELLGGNSGSIVLEERSKVDNVTLSF